MTSTDTPFAPTAADLATPAQLRFLATLLNDRDLGTSEDLNPRAELLDVINADDFTKAAASSLITWLKARPRRIATTTTASACTAPLAPGMYLLDGTPVRVQKSRSSDRLYAKALTADGFEYQSGLIHRLTADMRMTVEQAAEYGRRTGICCVCGRTLTAEDSVTAGIGPICGGRI